jgi:Fe-S-cluster containining protein
VEEIKPSFAMQKTNEEVFHLREFYAELDAVSETLGEMYPWLPCRKNCSSCCSRSVFLVSELEAAYISSFMKDLPRRKQKEIKERARKNVSAMRRKSGYVNWGRVVAECKEEISTCPLLEDGACSLYEARPSICRSYGNFIFDGDGGIYACPIVELAVKGHAEEGVRLPSFNFVAKRQAEVLKGRVKPLSAWLEG